MNEDISKRVSAIGSAFSPKEFFNLLNSLSILQNKLLFIQTLLSSMSIWHLLNTNLDVIVVVMMVLMFESFLQYHWLHCEHERDT